MGKFVFGVLFSAIIFSQDMAQAIVNFHPVDGLVFRGGRPATTTDFSTLVQNHIKTIVDLQGGDIHGRKPLYNKINKFYEPGETRQAILKEKAKARSVGIVNFFNKPLNSNDPITTQEEQTIAEILDILAAPENQPVYVHCAHGVDRTGLVMALYAVKVRHLTPQAAYKEMMDYGHKYFFHEAFTGHLDTYFWKVAPTLVSQ